MSKDHRRLRTGGQLADILRTDEDFLDVTFLVCPHEPKSKGPKRGRDGDEDFKKFFDEIGELVTPQPSQRVFRANRKLLAHYSSVFKVMFFGNLADTVRGHSLADPIRIVDTTPATFEVFLSYFYGPEIVITPENLADLYYLADKYAVYHLSESLDDYVIERLLASTRSGRELLDLHALSLRYRRTFLTGRLAYWLDRNLKESPVRCGDPGGRSRRLRPAALDRSRQSPSPKRDGRKRDRRSRSSSRSRSYSVSIASVTHSVWAEPTHFHPRSPPHDPHSRFR